MQPLSYYYYNVLEGLEKPCDVPSAQLQEGSKDLLARVQPGEGPSFSGRPG